MLKGLCTENLYAFFSHDPFLACAFDFMNGSREDRIGLAGALSAVIFVRLGNVGINVLTGVFCHVIIVSLRR